MTVRSVISKIAITGTAFLVASSSMACRRAAKSEPVPASVEIDRQHPRPSEPAGRSSLPIATPARNLIYPELQAVVRAVGTDPQALLKFVSGTIAFEPYAGVLRGPRGTLLAAAGNSLDQALLVRDLIRLARPDLQIRFASATLTPVAAAALLSGVGRSGDSTAGVRRILQAIGGTSATPTDATGNVNRGRSSDPAIVKAMTERGQRAWNDLSNADRADAETLIRPLVKAGVRFDSNRQQSEWNAAVAQHWWLQFRGPDGRWIDLDPTTIAGRPGSFVDSAVHAAETPPENAYHLVSIGVSYETRESGVLTHHPSLSTTWRTADLSGSTVTLAFVGTPHPGDGRAFIDYLPLLLVDDQRSLGTAITLPRVDAGSASMGGILGGGVGGMLGGGIGRPSNVEKRAASGPDVTAAWVDIAVTAPGRPSDITARPIFDRIGFVVRTSGNPSTAPLSPLEIADGDYNAIRTIWNVDVWTGERLPSRSLLDLAAPSTGLPAAYQVYEQLAALHRSVYILRDRLFRSTATAGGALASTADVSLLSWGIDKTVGILKLDLARSGATTDRSPDRLAAAIDWAIAGVRAEQVTLFARQLLNGAATPSASGPLGALEQVRTQGGDLALMPPNATVHVFDAPEADARLRASVDAGMYALVPVRVHLNDEFSGPTWWLVDPKSATVVDETADGGHQIERSGVTTTESVGQTAAEEQGFLTKVAHKIRCVGVAAQLLLGASRVWAGMHGAPPEEIVGGEQDVVDGLEGAAPECIEGEAGVDAPPVAAGGAPPPDPPRIKLKF